MGKGEPDREEILDTLEMVYAWHTMRFVEFFRRYEDLENSGNERKPKRISSLDG